MAYLHSLYDLAGAEQVKLAAGAAPCNGLPSGIGLERLVPGGIPRGMVTAVYSDEGSFKTTMVTHMLYSMAAAGHRVVMLSLEDSAALCAHRMLGRVSGVAAGRIHGGVLSVDERKAVATATVSDAARNVMVVDDAEPTITRCFDAARATPGCAAVVIDYIQLLDGAGSQRDVLDDAVKSCQLFARAAKVAVILVSQRTKVDDQREDPRPRSGDMFGSSSLRMGVKVAIGLFRPWTYCKVPTQPKGLYGPYCKWISANPELHAPLYANLLEVHVTKNVLGAPGAYHVMVEPERGIVQPYSLAGYI